MKEASDNKEVHKVRHHRWFQHSSHGRDISHKNI
jgi:hypothetical protein